MLHTYKLNTSANAKKLDYYLDVIDKDLKDINQSISKDNKDSFIEDNKEILKDNIIQLSKVRGINEEEKDKRILEFIDKKVNELSKDNEALITTRENEKNSKNAEELLLANAKPQESNIIQFSDVLASSTNYLDNQQSIKESLTKIIDLEDSLSVIKILDNVNNNLKSLLGTFVDKLNELIGITKDTKTQKNITPNEEVTANVVQFPQSTKETKESQNTTEEKESEENKKSGLAESVKLLIKSLSAYTAGLSLAVDTIYKGSLSAIDSVRETIETIVAGFIALQVIIPDLIGSIFGENSAIYKVVTTLIKIVDAAVLGVIEGLKAIFEGFGIIIDSILHLPENIKIVFSYLSDLVSDSISFIQDTLSKIFDTVISLPEKLLTGIWDSLKKLLSEVPYIGKYFKEEGEVSDTNLSTEKVSDVTSLPNGTLPKNSENFYKYINSYKVESQMTSIPADDTDVSDLANLAAAVKTYNMMNTNTSKIIESNNNINNSTKEVAQATNDITVVIDNKLEQNKPSTLASNAPYSLSIGTVF